MKYYQKKWFAWLMLFVFAPLGIFLLWKNRHHLKVFRIILTAFFGMVWLSVVFGEEEPKPTASVPRFENQQSVTEPAADSKEEKTETQESKPDEHKTTATTSAAVVPAEQKESSSSTTNSTIQSDQDHKILVTVNRVVDGDTIKVTLSNGIQETIRMLLIDTPETTGDDEPWGAEATMFLKSLVEGKQVALEVGTKGHDRDKYDRLLAYVFVGDLNINGKLIEEGYARVAYIYEPNTQYLKEFSKLQENAKSKKLRIWEQSGYVLVHKDGGFDPLVYDKKITTASSEQQNSTTTVTSNHDHHSHLRDDHDCKDFKTREEAQKFMEASIQEGYGDHNLDGRDKDGLACESL